MFYAALCGWVKLWNNWGVRGVLCVPVPHDYFYMQLVRSHEESIFSQQLGYLVQSLEPDSSNHLHLYVSVKFFVFRWPYDTIWFNENHEYWV